MRNPMARIGLLVLMLCLIGYMGLRALMNRGPKEPPKPTTKAVAVAKVDLYKRTVLQPGFFTIENRPVAEVPDTATSDPNQLQYQVLKGFVPAGNMILQSDLAGKVTDVGMAALVPPTMRAIVLEMKTEPNFHDILHVGDHVDVVATFENEYTRTIVEDVEVLAVDQTVGDQSLVTRGPNSPAEQQKRAQLREQNQQVPPAPPPPPSSVTLAVTPEQAERIALALSSGSLDFVLRPKDFEAENIESPEGTTVPAVSTEPGEGLGLDKLAPFVWKRKNARNFPQGGARPAAAPPVRAIYIPHPLPAPTQPVVVPKAPIMPVAPPTQPAVPATVAPPEHDVEVIVGSTRKSVQVPQPQE